MGAAPAIDYVGPWHTHPGFIGAQAERTDAVLRAMPDPERETAALVFTAHSIPAAMGARSDYPGQVTASAGLVAARLGRAKWQVAYQSRSGDPREPWLEPDVNEALRGLAARRHAAAVLVPIGFVTDHIEVLYDLDTEARATAAVLGVGYHRAATVMDHPEFIGMLADLIASRAG